MRSEITKAKNSHMRQLLVEATNSYSHGAEENKDTIHKDRQDDNIPEVIAYANKVNERLWGKLYKIAFRSMHNIAKAAVARELSCLVWGMMTSNISNVA